MLNWMWRLARYAQSESDQARRQSGTISQIASAEFIEQDADEGKTPENST